MNLLKFKKIYTGIDIGSHNIKGIKVKKSLHGFEIVQMAKKVIPHGAVRQGQIYDSAVLINVLREVYNELKPINPGAFLGFSGQQATIREIEMPVMNDRDLSKAIQWEADKVLPYPVDEAIIDWIVLERKRDTDQMMNVLLVAGRKDYIRSFLNPFKSVGIKPLNLSTLPIPLLNVMKQIPDFTEFSTVALVDMGAEVTHLLIIKDGLPRLSRTIPIGGSDFTDSISHSFSVPIEEAEEIKLNYASLVHEEIDINALDLAANPYLGIEDVLIGTAQDMMDEIKRSFVHFHMHNRGQDVKKIYLTGGSAGITGLIEKMSDYLNIPVRLLRLEKHFSYPPEYGQKLEEDSSFYAEALGLALSEV